MPDLRILWLATLVIVPIASAATSAVATNCSRVGVRSDATFCTNSKAICTGGVAGACPSKGDRAVADCAPDLASFVPDITTCVASEDAQCVQLSPSPEWTCVFPTARTIRSSRTNVTTLGMTVSTSNPPSPAMSSATLNGIMVSAVGAVAMLSVALVRRRHSAAPNSPPSSPPVTPLNFRDATYVRL